MYADFNQSYPKFHRRYVKRYVFVGEEIPLDGMQKLLAEVYGRQPADIGQENDIMANEYGVLQPSALLPAAAGSHPPDGPQRNSRTGLGQAPAVPDTAIRIRKLLGRYDLHTVQRLAALGAAMEPEQKLNYGYQRIFGQK